MLPFFKFILCANTMLGTWGLTRYLMLALFIGGNQHKKLKIGKTYNVVKYRQAEDLGPGKLLIIGGLNPIKTLWLYSSQVNLDCPSGLKDIVEKPRIEKNGFPETQACICIEVDVACVQAELAA